MRLHKKQMASSWSEEDEDDERPSELLVEPQTTKHPVPPECPPWASHTVQTYLESATLLAETSEETCIGWECETPFRAVIQSNVSGKRCLLRSVVHKKTAKHILPCCHVGDHWDVTVLGEFLDPTPIKIHLPTANSDKSCFASGILVGDVAEDTILAGFLDVTQEGSRLSCSNDLVFEWLEMLDETIVRNLLENFEFPYQET